jgi:hypothetical protein
VSIKISAHYPGILSSKGDYLAARFMPVCVVLIGRRQMRQKLRSCAGNTMESGASVPLKRLPDSFTV